jgi:hypothetical protein
MNFNKILTFFQGHLLLTWMRDLHSMANLLQLANLGKCLIQKQLIFKNVYF